MTSHEKAQFHELYAKLQNVLVEDEHLIIEKSTQLEKIRKSVEEFERLINKFFDDNVEFNLAFEEAKKEYVLILNQMEQYRKTEL